MDTFELIDMMLAKPYVFTGGESLTALRFFLNGYSFCRMENAIADSNDRYELLPLDWRLFTDHVRNNLTYDVPNSDWCDILMTYYGDKEGYRMFVYYYDIFRKARIKSYKRLTLTEEQKEHYSLAAEGGEAPAAAYLAELDSSAGWLSAVEFEGEIRQTRRIFGSEQQALQWAEELFGGEQSWFGVTGVEELRFKKPVRTE